MTTVVHSGPALTACCAAVDNGTAHPTSDDPTQVTCQGNHLIAPSPRPVDPRPVRHENHRDGADISDCPACRRRADAKGLDW